MKVLYVSAALLKNNAQEYFLVARPEGKSHPGMFELPGGKVENGETPELAMVRELKEELGIFVNEEDLLPVTFLSHNYSSYHVVMFVYEISKWQGEISLLEGQNQFVWATIEDFPKYPLLEADLVLFDQLRAAVESKKLCSTGGTIGIE